MSATETRKQFASSMKPSVEGKLKKFAKKNGKSIAQTLEDAVISHTRPSAIVYLDRVNQKGGK